jgi:hypothetical protein
MLLAFVDVPIGVFGGELVPMNTIISRAMSVDPDKAGIQFRVFLGAYLSQMARIPAGFVMADVMDVLPCRNRSYVQSVAQPVNRESHAVGKHTTIAILSPVPRPDPAPARLIPGAGWQFFKRGLHPFCIHKSVFGISKRASFVAKEVQKCP